MKNSKISVSGGVMPPCVNRLPLAWDWRRFRKIDDKSLRKFAKYIHWIIDCDATQGVEDAVTLLRDLVENARHE